MYGSYEATYIAYVGTTDAQLLQEHGEVTTRPQVCNPERGCGGCGDGCGDGCVDHGCGIGEWWWVCEGVVGVVNDKDTICR